ncbi:MAG TPA: hypothetical protein VGK88_12465 [bacterium]|jgi:hypothetical protein
MKRGVVIGIIAMVVAAAGVLAYVKLRPGQAVQGQQDPALQIAVALAALERSDTALTVEQITVVLPLLKVLRDTDPNDTEASKALADSIRKVLTSEQLATIDRMRQEAQARRQQGGQGFQGPRRGPGGPGFAPGGTGAQGRASFRAQARQVLLTRLIRRLESRL